MVARTQLLVQNKVFDAASKMLPTGIRLRLQRRLGQKEGIQLVITIDCVPRYIWNLAAVSPHLFVTWALNFAHFQQSCVGAILLQECSIN